MRTQSKEWRDSDKGVDTLPLMSYPNNPSNLLFEQTFRESCHGSCEAHESFTVGSTHKKHRGKLVIPLTKSPSVPERVQERSPVVQFRF